MIKLIHFTERRKCPRRKRRKMTAQVRKSATYGQWFSAFAVCALLACGPRGKMAELLTSPVELSTSVTVITPNEPLTSEYEVDLLCIGVPPGYREGFDDWTLVDSSGTHLQIRAEIDLVDGQTLSMSVPSFRKSRSSFFCLSPAANEPGYSSYVNVPAAVRTVRLWSTKPITVNSIEWRTEENM
jgi:hypothetical protein